MRITRADPGASSAGWAGGSASAASTPSASSQRNLHPAVHGEVFTGALAGVLGFAFRRQIPVLERFDRALRNEAERRSGR